jgi:Domain of unknown function (DUF6089)
MRLAKSIAAVGLIVLFADTHAQQMLGQRSEVGFGIGTFNYTGDLVRTYNLAFSKPAATVFYRSNISQVISFRTAITGGKIGASDSRNPIDPLAVNRAASFNLFLLEGSGTFEYHFLNWRDDKRRLRFTPYLFAGAALFGISGVQQKNAEYSNIQLAIPFGGGMKYVINPKYYVAFEFGMRKTFFDYLDNISDGDLQLKNYQYGNVFDTDNYFFAGFTLTYTFYDIPCPSSPYR